MRKEILRDLCVKWDQTVYENPDEWKALRCTGMPSSCNYASTASPGIINSHNNPCLLCDLQPATDIWLRHHAIVMWRDSQPRLGWRARWVPVVLEGPSDRTVPYLLAVRADPAETKEHGEMSWNREWLCHTEWCGTHICAGLSSLTSRSFASRCTLGKNNVNTMSSRASSNQMRVS